jgi:hypothetical protein
VLTLLRNLFAVRPQKYRATYWYFCDHRELTLTYVTRRGPRHAEEFLNRWASRVIAEPGTYERRSFVNLGPTDGHADGGRE